MALCRLSNQSDSRVHILLCGVPPYREAQRAQRHVQGHLKESASASLLFWHRLAKSLQA